MTLPLRDRTVAIQRSIETGLREPLHYFDSRTYIQHNLSLGDGLQPLLEFLDSIPPGSARVRPHRAFQDGQVSFAHLEYWLPSYGHVIGFEVHRWQNDRIVEHWDNLQLASDQSNLSGRSMVDGPAEAGDPELTAENKRRIREFADVVLIEGRHDQLAAYVASDLAEHSPSSGDGIDAFAARLASETEPIKTHRVHHLLGEGNFVLTISEGQVNRQHCAVYDLFRLEDGLVAEHWDVVEPIPAREQWRNENGKF